MIDWVYCPIGQGFLHGGLVQENRRVSLRRRHFKVNSVGIRKEVDNDFAVIWL